LLSNNLFAFANKSGGCNLGHCGGWFFATAALLNQKLRAHHSFSDWRNSFTAAKTLPSDIKAFG